MAGVCFRNSWGFLKYFLYSSRNRNFSATHIDFIHLWGSLKCTCGDFVQFYNGRRYVVERRQKVEHVSLLVLSCSWVVTSRLAGLYVCFRWSLMLIWRSVRDRYISTNKPQRLSSFGFRYYSSSCLTLHQSIVFGTINWCTINWCTYDYSLNNCRYRTYGKRSISRNSIKQFYHAIPLYSKMLINHTH